MTAGIAVITCVALCAAVWPRSAEVDDLPTEPVKTAVTAEIEARSEGISKILFSAESPASDTEAAAESEQENLAVISEEKTETAPPIAPTSQTVSKSVPASTQPKPGDRTVIDGRPISGYQASDGLLTMAAAASEQWSAIPIMSSPVTRLARWVAT